MAKAAVAAKAIWDSVKARRDSARRKTHGEPVRGHRQMVAGRSWEVAEFVRIWSRCRFTSAIEGLRLPAGPAGKLLTFLLAAL